MPYIYIYMAVCHLFGSRMTTSKPIFFATSNFGPRDPQVWAQEALEAIGEALDASRNYREAPRSPPHGNP